MKIAVLPGDGIGPEIVAQLEPLLNQTLGQGLGELERLEQRFPGRYHRPVELQFS